MASTVPNAANGKQFWGVLWTPGLQAEKCERRGETLLSKEIPGSPSVIWEQLLSALTMKMHHSPEFSKGNTAIVLKVLLC